MIGAIDLLHRVGFRLKNAEVPGSGWPSLLQVPDAAQISGRLGYPVSSYQVLLSPAAEEGYLRDWREVKLDPGKNQGYALQWFLFAAVALIFYVRHALSRRTPHSS